MAFVYSRNRRCDTENWVGEITLPGFERTVYTEDVAKLTPIESFEGAIESFWPLFIEDSSLL